MRTSIVVLVLALSAVTVAHAADGDKELRLGKSTLHAGDPGRAMELLQQAVAKGNLEAMHYIGLMYQEGTGVAADAATAAQWFKRAADKGHPPSMNNYGNWLRTDHPAEALEWHLKAAAGGDPFAMANAGGAYYEGIGTEKDLVKAAEWYRKAAEHGGNSNATLQWGYMLCNGQGVAQDVKKGFAMYLAAAREGESAAMYNLGDYYIRGKGGTKIPSAARFWFLRSAMSGDTDGEAEVARLASVASESPEGAALLAESERLRNTAHTNAEFAAAKAKGFPMVVEAAELGHLPAIAMLVNAYQYGQGTEKDLAKAREWALIAAEMGQNSDQNIIAQFMLKGIGGPRNTQGARFWFEKAALGGNSLAMSFLAAIYDGEYGLPPNDALATYWWFEAFKHGSPTATKVLQDRGLVAKRDPVAQAFVDRIDRNGPDQSSVEKFTLEVAQYCKYDGDRCHELSVAALKFQRSNNAAAESANMARLWNTYGSNGATDDAKWRERSDCMKKKTESIQKHTYGQQDWYYSGTCY